MKINRKIVEVRIMRQKTGFNTTIKIFNKKVKKTGDEAVIQGEFWAYQRLKNFVSPEFFPEILNFKTNKNRATLVLNLLIGKGNLEDYIMETQDEEDRFYIIQRTFNKVLETLNHWRNINVQGNPELLLMELIESIKYARGKIVTNNFEIGSLLKLLSQCQIKNYLLSGLRLTPCHRDLGAQNIWITNDNNIKLFDPDYSLPGSAITSAGHILLDLASFKISIERLQSDRAQKGIELKLPLNLVDQYISQLIQQGIFCSDLYNLALLRRYLDFVNCNCSFCAANDRVHRFELMEDQAKKISKELITNLRRLLCIK